MLPWHRSEPHRRNRNLLPHLVPREWDYSASGRSVASASYTKLAPPIHDNINYLRRYRYLPGSTYEPSRYWLLYSPTIHDQIHDSTTNRKPCHPPSCTYTCCHKPHWFGVPYPNAAFHTNRSFL